MFTVLFVTVPPYYLSMLCVFSGEASASPLCVPHSPEPGQQPAGSHTKFSQSLSRREQVEPGIPPAHSVQDQSRSQLQGKQQSETLAQHPSPQKPWKHMLGNQDDFLRGINSKHF